MPDSKRLLENYLKRADQTLGKEAEAVVREHYSLHGSEDCDHDDCYFCDGEHRDPNQDEQVRQLAQDWHDAERERGLGFEPNPHSIGSYRLCGHERCRRADELLGDR